MVTVQQAALNALKAYLVTLTASGGLLEGITIEDRWPEPDQPLAGKTVTLLLAGEREDMRLDEDVIDQTVVSGEPNNMDYRWEVKACRQPLQVDVWANTEVDRDDILARWDEVSHHGPLFTLGSGNPVADGLLVALDKPTDGHPGHADFLFEGPQVIDNPDAHRQQEYRARIRGHVNVNLSVVAKSAKLARLKFELSMGSQTENYQAVPDGSGGWVTQPGSP